MIVEFARRAVADISRIADGYAASPDPGVSVRFRIRLENVIERVALNPSSARPVPERAGVRVALLLPFPFKMFYRVLSGNRIRILHVRHMSRAPWRGGE